MSAVSANGLAAVAAALAKIQAENGRLEVGISASADKVESRAFMVHILASDEPAVRASHAVNNQDYGSKGTTGFTKLLAGAAYAIAYYGLNGYTGEVIKDAQANTMSHEVGKSLGELDVGDGLLFVITSKLTWYATNHHLPAAGQTCYVNKVLKRLLGDTITDDQRKRLHAVAHGACTRSVLFSLGVSSICHRETEVFTQLKDLGADIMMRVEGFPAGAHKVAVAYAGARALFSSRLRVLVPDNEILAHIIGCYDRIAASPANYHVGAKYLTDQARLTDAEISTEALEIISAYVHVFMAGSTLVKSPSIIREDSITNVDFVNSLRAAKRSIAAHQLSVDFSMSQNVEIKSWNEALRRE